MQTRAFAIAVQFVLLMLTVADSGAQQPTANNGLISRWQLSKVICAATCSGDISGLLQVGSTLEIGDISRTRLTDLDWCEGSTNLKLKVTPTASIKQTIKLSAPPTTHWHWKRLGLNGDHVVEGSIECLGQMIGNTSQATTLLRVIDQQSSRMLIWLDGPVFLEFTSSSH